MAEIKAFKGLIADKNHVRDIISLPYDILSRDEYRGSNNQKSFLNIIRADVEFNDSVDENSDCVYQKAKENLNKFIANKWLIIDSKPCLYIYKQVFNKRIQIGIVCLMKTDDYKKGLIKKHEQTLDKKVLDRKKHINCCNANTGSVFLAYKENSDIRIFLHKYMENNDKEFEIDFNNTEHYLWKIENEESIQQFYDCFKPINDFYIIDGHHRAKASSELNNKYMLCTLFSHTQLYNMSNNRVISEVAISENEIVEKLKKHFLIIDINKNAYFPSREGEITMYVNGYYYLLKIKSDDSRIIDCSYLQTNALQPVFGIENPSTDERFLSIGGIKGEKYIIDMIDNSKNKVAFFMYAIPVKKIIRCCDENILLPPKSTWFEPKIASGLFSYVYEK